MIRQRVIVWFRQDLRLHDNEALTHAIQSGIEVYPVFIFDERLFHGETKFGFRKTGVHRAKFTIEAIQDLKKSLRKLGSNLIVRIGKPEEALLEIARDIKSSWVFCNRERTREEITVQDTLERNLWSIGQEIIYSRGKMLYYTQDLPFPVTHTPDSFTTFRKEVEKIVPVREPLGNPEDFRPVTAEVTSEEVPTLASLGYDEDEITIAEKEGTIFKGGETAALSRLQYYLWESDHIADYKKTRNGLLGTDYSSKFSAWLALGCVSPKKIYHELKRYEEERTKNDSTYWMFFELLWRDFFRLTGKKHGDKIFLKGGIRNKINEEASNDLQLAKCWIEGRTGVPFIDANMRELAMTGFMSNRGRQNVASFFINDLKLNWQIGASYFESMLLDYDPTSNWGNWCYLAGVGNDPRDDRYFNILKQAQRYDPKGEYVKHWLPELSRLPDAKVHRPESLSEEESKGAHFQLGNHYPKSMVSMNRWER
ncbi:MAG: deoxyribodipyrimidine photo-lyase [Polaribacter sp.]|jgi:deoxyribodipyrimidine photo-lyase